MSFLLMPTPLGARRLFLGRSTAALSGAAVALLAGKHALAAKLEQGEVSSYQGAVPLFGDRELARAAASILGDEAMHWAALRQTLGQAPVPSAFAA